MSRIAPCLWFDGRAEEAANFYVSLFPDSRIGAISRYGAGAHRSRQGPRCWSSSISADSASRR